MKLTMYQVDAFTEKVFTGNPAAVVPLKKWLPQKTMLKIAAENNLSETAFFVKRGKDYHIRWMTPAVEVPLCGHATLASAFVIFNYLDKRVKKISFKSKSGKLSVEKDKNLIKLNFPSRNPVKKNAPLSLLLGLKMKPEEVYYSEGYYLVVYKSEKDVFSITPDFNELLKLKSSEVIVTAPGTRSDFVSRMFAPMVGINEDPVTGSAHTILTPYWSKRLNKKELKAFQISKRGGELQCRDLGTRTEIAGKAVLYLKGDIYI